MEVDFPRPGECAANGAAPHLNNKMALERLASTEPWDLCSEAKVEKCRSTRDLRSCGRAVRHLLTSCGHACLCIECSQRCDICPLCRSPILATRSALRLRLYDECADTGLLSPLHDEDLRDFKEGPYWTMDACRLCSFFDVAVENGLVSLVCHYVTDVCLDEAAVSSDPIISMLLDGTVVKEWCKRTLFTTVRMLRDAYNSKASQSKSAGCLDRHETRLQAVVYVLEALEAPLDELSPAYVELRQLLESVRIVLQHLEVMSWCMRLRFLSDIRSCYVSIGHWKADFQERKQAADARVWLDCLDSTTQTRPQGTLFIEDALSVGRDDGEVSNGVLDLGLLRESAYSTTGSDYPPDNTRAAVDLLFLEGSPDDFFAKTAIFLYYLFDRHWTLPEPEWRHVIEDYVLSFSIPRQSMLESFVYYLLDNNTDAALQEASRFLPEIVGPNLHPKIARVLLERERPSTALSVLQSTGRFSPREDSPAAASLFDAVTVVRVLLESGLLSEAYLYQQAHCQALRTSKAEDRDWLQEMDVLVGEVCWFCIRKNIVVKMLVLSWNAGDEKILRKCLLEQAVQDPSNSAGSLLMVFYLQRCRFGEAYSVHKTLYELELPFLSENSGSDALAMLQKISEYRTKLIEKALEALPDVEREQILSGVVTEEASCSSEKMETLPEEPQAPQAETVPANLLIQTPLTGDISFKSPAVRSSFRQANGTPSAARSPLLNSPLLAPPSPGLSPLLGKRLRYETDLRFGRHSEQQPKFQSHQQPASSKKDRTQAMVVTW